MLALQGYYRINKSNHEAKHSKLELKRRIALKQAKENQNNYEIFVLTGSNLNTSCSNEGQGMIDLVLGVVNPVKKSLKVTEHLGVLILPKFFLLVSTKALD